MKTAKCSKQPALTSMPSPVSVRQLTPLTRKGSFGLQISNPDLQNICTTCGTRYAPAKWVNNECPICLDDRQYVRKEGQEWTSFDSILQNHSIKLRQHTEDLFEITTWPGIALGQRAFFIKSGSGNILWDCIPLITEPVVAFMQQHGGVQAIAISHPHYYSLMNEWAKAFAAPIYLHQADKEWVMDNQENIVFWSGKENKLTPDATIIHTGGHFAGSAVLHTNIEKPGPALFTGDSFYLSKDKQHLSAMYSYPNLIPLTNAETIRVFNSVEPYEFDAIFGAFAGQDLYEGGRAIFENSLRRYRFAFGK